MKKKPVRYYLTYLWTNTWDLIVWLGVLLMWLFWGEHLRWNCGLWFDLKRNSWPTRTWYRVKDKHGCHISIPVEHQPTYGRYQTWGGTALGHGGFFGPGRAGGPGIDTKVEKHEHKHPEQWEVALLVGWLTQLLVMSALLLNGVEPFWFLHLVLWTISAPFAYSCSVFQAWLRGEDPYRENIYEESVYAQVEVELELEDLE